MPFAMALNNKIQLYFHIFFFSFNISSHSVFFFSFECVFFSKAAPNWKMNNDNVLNSHEIDSNFQCMCHIIKQNPLCASQPPNERKKERENQTKERVTRANLKALSQRFQQLASEPSTTPKRWFCNSELVKCEQIWFDFFFFSFFFLEKKKDLHHSFIRFFLVFISICWLQVFSALCIEITFMRPYLNVNNNKKIYRENRPQPP